MSVCILSQRCEAMRATGVGAERSDAVRRIRINESLSSTLPGVTPRTRMELAHFGRVEIQIFFKKADFFRPVLREFMITL